MTAQGSSAQAPLGLNFSLKNSRTLVDRLLTSFALLVSVVALFPLFSVLYMLIVRGGQLLSPTLFTELTPGAGMEGGGIGNAVLGSLVVVAVASLISLPLGLLSAIYLAEYAGESRLGTVVRFAGKVLTGMPSILAGVFAYAAIVVSTGSFSAFAGSVAMSVLMVPTIMLTAEQALRGVPEKMRLAALGMGATRAEAVLKIVVPTALPGILTGLILAMARAAGEVAPLMLTGVVKLAPSLPLDGSWPFFHFDRKFMHLGFHIYDVGFQSPNVEAAKPMVYITTLVLITVVVLLNCTAIVLRNHLRKKYAGSVL